MYRGYLAIAYAVRPFAGRVTPILFEGEHVPGMCVAACYGAVDCVMVR